MRVLLVDDSRAMRLIQKKVLADIAGVRFVEAGDGAEAMCAISAARFQLIIVDWNSGTDGIALVKQIRKVDRIVPLIMVTTETRKHQVLDALKAGVNDYILKPFTAAALVEKARGAMQRAKAAA